MLFPPEPLSDAHDLNTFMCGVPPLDEWLRRHARQNETEGASRTFVMRAGEQVVGYYTLAASSLMHATATGRIRRNMPDPVPVVLLGRLAVDGRWQGKGLGSSMLRDAVLRTLAAADTLGIRALLVHAISDEARAFYEKHGFRPSPVEPMTLMITMNEAARELGR
jgi:GNAT superfamily N-acetyltransferase